jgi:hydroxyacylglutathione hydrolase
VLVGAEKVLVLDTGGIKDLEGFSLYQEIEAIIGEENHQKEMLVIHSHGDRDHFAGDDYFIGQPSVTVIGASAKEMKTYFDFERWPETLKDIELGNRTLTVIPTPGHHEGAISIYDHDTKWLLTGDTLYPG